MKSSTAKALAGVGNKIVKIVTWDSMSQTWNSSGSTTKIERTTYELVAEDNRYHENGDMNEEGWRLSEVLDTDAVLELHAANGFVWKASITTVEGITGK